jgi:hypothetical protein
VTVLRMEILSMASLLPVVAVVAVVPHSKLSYRFYYSIY